MPQAFARPSVFTLGALVAASVLLAACSRQEAAPEPVRAVKVVSVGAPSEPGQSGQSLYAGEVRARVESRLGFRVAGKLMQRAVDAGQRVAAGQLLAAMDPQDYQLSAQAAQAQLLAAQSQRDVALADYKRYESLRAQGFISGAELERREANLKAADASLPVRLDITHQAGGRQDQVALDIGRLVNAVYVRDVTGAEPRKASGTIGASATPCTGRSGISPASRLSQPVASAVLAGRPFSRLS